MSDLAYTWRCAGPATVPPTPCPEHGDGPGSDKAAERHTKASGHMTVATAKEAKK